MKRIIQMLFIVPICVLSMLTMIYFFSKDEPLFFLKNIRINGTCQLGDRDIMGKAAPFLRESIFRIDVLKMKEAITSHPFVKEVSVRRVFPFSLVIDVKEKRPSALWVNSEGSVYVIDENGVPYRGLTRGGSKDLFIINSSTKEDLGSLYRQVTSWTSAGIIRKEALSEVVYKDGNITIYGQEDGVEIILGKEDQQERLKKAIAVLEDAKKRGLLIKCIDARFEKGAIIQERKG
jgi:cell division protein FtsQ